MRIQSTRFGQLDVVENDVISFPAGLPGLSNCMSWVLLADADNEALGWLQSINQPDVALAVVSPSRFVPDYELRVGRAELGAMLCDRIEELQVLVIVSSGDHGITLNLKAPLVIHLRQGIARQVISNSEHSVQHELTRQTALLRKVA